MKQVCALIACLAFLHGGASFPVDKTSASARPNIFFSIADDWGIHSEAYGTKWVNPTDFEKAPLD